jgi:NADH-quinone oxidoreductase subunit N
MNEIIQSLQPWIVLSVGILFTLLASVVRVETRRPAQIAALLSLGATLWCSLQSMGLPAEALVGGAVEVSPLSRFMLALFSALGIFFILSGDRYLTKERINLSDYYHLLLILILGASILVAAKDLVVLFIALEVMSLPAYTLTGFRRNDSRSNEAAIKYFILGGAVGAVFLLGAAFLFGATGSTLYPSIHNWSPSVGAEALLLFGTGHFLVLVAFLFKVAAAPFHFWKPDVYEGAPAPVTGIMATVVTAAAWIALVRLVHLPNLQAPEWAAYLGSLKTFVRSLALLSLLVGSVVVITQKNLKRMLAYSSISHTGYLLLGLLATLSAEEQLSSVLIYLAGYLAASVGVFALLSQSEPRADTGMELVDLTGLLKRSPFRTALWSLFLFSLAGMPFTVGFFSKYFVFLGSVGAGEVSAVVVAALCTVVASYAYLRPVALMVMREADPGAASFSGGFLSQWVVVVSAALVVFLGLMPNAMIHYLKGIPLIH